MTTLKGPNRQSTIYCSFCGKSQHEVKGLIEGPSVHICDECLKESVAILVHDLGIPLEYFDPATPHLDGRPTLAPETTPASNGKEGGDASKPA